MCGKSFMQNCLFYCCMDQLYKFPAFAVSQWRVNYSKMLKVFVQAKTSSKSFVGNDSNKGLLNESRCFGYWCNPGANIAVIDHTFLFMQSHANMSMSREIQEVRHLNEE